MKVSMPDDATLDRLKLSPEIAFYLLSRGYDLPNCPPKFKTPEPRDVPGAYFDPIKVDHVVFVFSKLEHTTGKWRGQPITLRPWQIAYLIGPTYGWVKKDSDGIPRRIIHRQFLDIPRKNAKTTIGGGQCIYLTTADNEPGAQVYALATSKEQARFCFDPVRDIALRAEMVSEHVTVLKERIEHPRSGSYFSVMASIGAAMHGASPHAAFVDEVHLHKTRDLIEAVETGAGARTQPLIMYATTADDNAPNSPYSELRDYLEKLAAGTITDPSFYGVVFGADRDDDPFDPATWIKANPGLAAGDSPTMEFIEQQANAARNSPAELASFLRLHLGIRTKQSSRYITLEEWDRNAGLVDESSLRGRVAFGGIDLGNVADLTAVSWIFPDGRGAYDVLWRFWLPEAQVPVLDKRTAGAMSRWVAEGRVVVTPGATTDYEFVLAQVRKDRDTFKVKEIGFDPWNGNELTKGLAEERAPLVEVRQGYKSMSPPMKEIKRLLAAGTAEEPRLRHGGNPVMRWMTDNLAVVMDPAGNVKPDKSRAAEKIDGWSALVTGMSRAMHYKVRRSMYAADETA